MNARDDPEARRARVRDGLSALATGRFTERLRLEAAASLLVLTHRALQLARGGLWEQLASNAPGAGLERIVAAWRPEDVTAAEYVETLMPADVKALIELGPIWAESMLAAEAARAAPPRPRPVRRSIGASGRRA